MWWKRMGQVLFYEIFSLFLLLVFAGSASAAISNVSIDTGTSGSLKTVTITPDEDGNADRAFIHFSSDVDASFRVIVDTDGDSLFEPPDWADPNSWKTSDATMDGFIGAGENMEFMYEGRDNTWNVLPNGTYDIKIITDVDGDWSTTGDQASDTSLTVTIDSLSISGTVYASDGTTPISDAEVHAGSQYGWGMTFSASDGTYTISGLKEGSYHVDVMKSGYVNGNYPTDVSVSSGNNATGIDFSLSPSVQISGTITIPSTFTSFTNMWGGQEDQLWININAWSDDGSEWTWGNAHIHATDSWVCQQAGNDDDNDGIADADECSTTASYAIDITPPASGQSKTYHMRAESDGYSSSEVTVTVDSSGGTKNLTLSKSSRIYGTVTLPAANATGGQIWLDVNARTADGDMAWGGGSIDNGQTQGSFDIRSALPGTYTVEVRAWGYKTTTVNNVTVTAGQDTDLGDLTVSQGGSISGTVTITGDTTNYKTYADDDGSQPINLWLDAWSPDGGWGGTQVQVPRGTNQSATYTIGGLDSGTYEIHSWMGEGYEQTPMPLTATVSGDSAVTGVDLTFGPFSGAISGTVSGNGVDLTKVVVKATKAGWGEWQEPVTAQPSSDGTYLLEGLGTSEYIVEVNEYSNASQMLQGMPGMPSGSFGSETKRVLVTNGTTTTGQDFTLSTGASISGTIAMETGYSGSVSFANDLVGQSVMAIPMKMAMMGGSSMFQGQIQADGSYTISGLGAGAYIVSPPTELVDHMANFDPNAQTFQDQFTPDVAVDDQMIAVSAGEAKTGVNFTLADGYSVSGTLTLPEAPSGNEWDWVTDIELRHPRKGGMGRHIPVFVKDFREDPSDPNSTMTTTYSFTLEHVADGDYVVQAWTPNYTVANKSITVNGSDVVGANLELKKGANIEGKLVDAVTGEVITPNDGIRVRCEAHPWVEGSWRETFNDPWSTSRFIQVDQNGDETTDSSGTYTGQFRLANLPAGTYVVTVEAEHGFKQNGAKNYVGIRKAGVVVPDTEGATVDIGTLQLKEGVTISGTVTSEASGNAIGNIEVCAEPVDEKDGATWSCASTDSKGKYKIYGVDPDVKYYTVIGGSRPDFMEFIPVTWGEVDKDVEVGTTGLTGIDFELPAANASLSGTIHKTGSSPWRVPFMDDEMPAPFLLLQRQGEVYSDPMDGIEVIGEPSDSDTTTFNIDGIVPGTYNLKVFCMGYTTKIVRDIVITEGANTLSTVELVEGGTVSGSIVNDDGTYPTTGEVNQAVVVSDDMDVIIFGSVTSNSATREVTAYSVTGLEDGKSYHLVLVNDSEDGPFELHVMPDLVQGGDTYNAVLAETEPIITARAKKNDDGTFTIAFFSTTYLNDASADDILSVDQGTISATMGTDKMEVTGTYTPPASIIDPVYTVTFTAHYGENNSVVTKVFQYDMNSTAFNEGKIESLLGGSVGMGQGDKSKVFFEPGDITDGEGDGITTVTMQKDDSVLTSNGLSTSGLRRESLLAEATPDLPSYATPASALYDIDLPSADSITSGASVTVQLQYSSSITDTSDLHIYHYTGGEWVAEDTNRSVDTVNHTITADVTSLSPFEVGDGSASSSSSSSSSTSSSSGGGCALSSAPVTPVEGLPGMILLLLPVFVLAMLRRKGSAVRR